MRHSSGKGQVEPLAALAAVFAVCIGLAVYAGAVDGVLGGDEREISETVLDRTVSEAGPPGVVTVTGLRDDQIAPPGWQANVTLRTETGRHQFGPVPPEDAQQSRRTVAVQVNPGRVLSGRLTVEVWQ